MGYTHYFIQEKPLKEDLMVLLDGFAMLAEYAKEELGIKICGAYGEPDTDYEINLKGMPYIAFNGASYVDEDLSCDTFHLSIAVEGEAYEPGVIGAYNFCKTNRNPYDILACATLILMAAVGNNEVWGINSDGSNEYMNSIETGHPSFGEDGTNWAEAFDLFCKIFDQPDITFLHFKEEHDQSDLSCKLYLENFDIANIKKKVEEFRVDRIAKTAGVSESSEYENFGVFG